MLLLLLIGPTAYNLNFADSLLACSLFLDDEPVANGSRGAVVAPRRGHYAVTVSGDARIDDGGRHRVTLTAEDVAAAESRTFAWSVDAFDDIVDVAVDLPTPAIATGSSRMPLHRTTRTLWSTRVCIPNSTSISLSVLRRSSVCTAQRSLAGRR